MGRPARASRRSCSPFPLHQCNQLLDVSNGRILKNAVPEIEDVRSVAEGVKDATDDRFEDFPASNERKGIKIALERKIRGELPCGPKGIDGLIEADCINASLPGVGAKLPARAFWK